MEPAHYTSLLPEIFRHKTTKVRVFQPQVILLDFHGTISELKWEEKVIYPYVEKALSSYLRENWSNEDVRKCIPGLREESFEQRFRNKYEDAPIIEDNEDVDPINLARQLSDYVSWQLSTKRETKESRIIERLVWKDGFKRKRILLPIYEDVMKNVERWRKQYSCSVYVTSSLDSETLKLLFENTDKGNLHQLLNGYLSSKKSVEKLYSETYKRFYEKILHMGEDNKHGLSHGSSSSSSDSLRGLRKRPNLDDVPESQVRPILFLTDSGQEAKSASQVNNGSIFECLLVNRPGNRRIRTYYLCQFPYIDKFDDIEFIK